MALEILVISHDDIKHGLCRACLSSDGQAFNADAFVSCSGPTGVKTFLINCL